MRQTLEASKQSTTELYADEHSTYTGQNTLGDNNPAIFNGEDSVSSHHEGIAVDQQAILAHETLRRLVQLRNMYDTNTFPISGDSADFYGKNPTDKELSDAAAEVAALTLDKTKTHALNLQSTIPDNTGFYQPPSVEVASLLVNAATETQDQNVKAFAEAALPAIDQDIAEPLSHELGEKFHTVTDEEKTAHEEALILANLQERYKLPEAKERRERVAQYSEEELRNLQNDDAEKADMSAFLDD